eukprot:c8982_g1_i3.p1 GENE.c8982_g1_i3~~c8982_g1_i3.p1  ORF type:complete len:754 (+),score=196.56 c8982_g1_i3:17-2278(+)
MWAIVALAFALPTSTPDASLVLAGNTFPTPPPALPSQVGIHNVAQLANTSTIVYTSCADDGLTPLEIPLSGAISLTSNTTAVVTITWSTTPITTSTRSLCALNLFTSVDDAKASKCELRQTVVVAPPAAGAGAVAVDGYVDTHIHMFSERGFGGRMIFGSALGDIDKSLAKCDGTSSHGLGIYPNTDIAALFDRLFSCDDGEIPTHANNTVGYPDFAVWPRWNDWTHQQVHVTWLRSAFEKGLRIAVISVVNNEMLCELVAEIAGVEGSDPNLKCDDESNILEQLKQAHEMAQQHQDWLEIASNSSHARAIATSGKLAIVLHAESSNLFGHQKPSESVSQWISRKLDLFYEKGIRSLQLVHEFNNELAGASLHAEALALGNDLEMWREEIGQVKAPLEYVADIFTRLINHAMFGDQQYSTFSNNPSDGRTEQNATANGNTKLPDFWGKVKQCPSKIVPAMGRAIRWLLSTEKLLMTSRPKMVISIGDLGSKENPIGLSEIGKEVVKQSIAKGILVDAAHLSRPAGHDYFNLITNEYNSYPYFVSHAQTAQPTSIFNSDFRADHHIMHWIMSTGGIWGMMSAAESSPTYFATRVPNDCHGSVKSFIQHYQAVQAIGVPIAVASDMNGFATHFAPRMGSVNETCTTKWEEMCVASQQGSATECSDLWTEANAQRESQTTPTGTAYDVKGLASIDLWDAALKDMETLGADLSTIKGSAERFLQMWERADNVNRTPLSTAPPPPDLIKSFLFCSLWH